MSLDASLHIPWHRMTQQEQAYWNDVCTCRHTRLDHLPRGCDRCPRTGLLRRPACRRFVFYRTLANYIRYEGVPR